MPDRTWDATLYQSQHAFVWESSQDLLSLLAPQPGEVILDLGCGTSQLTQQIAASGAEVTGLDASPEMVEQARQNYPHIPFAIADARSFTCDRQQDAVFSNAVLHWVTEPEQAMAFGRSETIACIHRALKPGGRFVAEFGGRGNVAQIVATVSDVLTELGCAATHPWYFPSISDYSVLLERQGFQVTYASLRDRPTPLAGGDMGLGNWLRMFGGRWLDRVPVAQCAEVVEAVVQRLQPSLYRDGTWIVDYRRIRNGHFYIGIN
jgi:trans-aconitate 2-methyltransferase